MIATLVSAEDNQATWGAMTAVAQAAAASPLVDPELHDLIDRASAARGLDVSVADFVAATEKVAVRAQLGYLADARLSRDLQLLERAVRQYRACTARPSA